MEKEAKQNKHVKAESKQIQIKVGFLGMFMCTHEQACVCIIKLTCTGFCPENPKNTKIG